MEMSQTNRVFQFSERGFNAPAHMVQSFDVIYREFFCRKVRNDTFKSIVRDWKTNDTHCYFIEPMMMQINKIECCMFRNNTIFFQFCFYRICLFFGQYSANHYIEGIKIFGQLRFH